MHFFGHETRHMISGRWRVAGASILVPFTGGCIAPLFGVQTLDPPEATGDGSSSSDIPFGPLSPEHIAGIFIARTSPG